MSSPIIAKDLESSSYVVHAPREALPLNGAPVSPIPKRINVESRGIYHGLPIYGEEFNGKSALVAGGNGISGAYMLKVMADYPDIWQRIYCISRRPQMNDVPAKFSSHSIDLYNNDKYGVAKDIQEAGIKQIDYAFFYAFMPVAASDDRTLFKEAEELAEINGKIFDNFLEGLYLAGLRPKRILLQTGCKGYGQHYGPMICPLIEDSIQTARNYKEPNFYYSQEDILWKFSKRTGIEWVESRPSFIVGLVKDNNLNFFSPLLLYAAVSKYQGKKELVFPGDRRGWDKLVDLSTAYHNGLEQQWMMLAPHAANQAFHTADGSNFCWNRFWPWLATQFGMTTKPPPADDEGNYTSLDMQQDCEVGYPYRANIKYQFLLSDWCKDKQNRADWELMGREFDLDLTLMDQPYMFAIADFSIYCWWPLVLNMNKARKFGYHGMVDSFEGLEETIELGRKLKIIPNVRY